MGNIHYKKFRRLLKRSAEVAGEPNAPAAVKVVFEGVLAAPLAAFVSAHRAVTLKESREAKEADEARDALRDVDQAFRVTRGVVLAFVPTTVLPETLRSQRTDTDKLTAIEDLLAVLDEHLATPWAAAELAGAFGAKAPVAVKELTEAIAANKELSAAQAARAVTYGPAYEAYLALKRVVRDACGPSSKQYQRIHLRANGELTEEEGEGEGEGEESSGAPPAPAK